MKTKFLAGLIATFVSLSVVIGISIFLALVLDVEPTKNWFTTTAAFLTIGSWAGVYSWLKPKAPLVLDERGRVVEPTINRIDSTTFKKAYLRNARIQRITGIFLSLFFLGGGICILLFSDDLSAGLNITGLILFFLFGGFGLLIIYKSTRLTSQINNGTDHLMSAIENNDTAHVLWFHGITTQVQGNPVKTMKSYQIAIYTQEHKKAVVLAIKNEKAYLEILSFLETKFPEAEMGYSEEIKRAMKEKFGFKGIR